MKENFPKLTALFLLQKWNVLLISRDPTARSEENSQYIRGSSTDSAKNPRC